MLFCSRHTPEPETPTPMPLSGRRTARGARPLALLRAVLSHEAAEDAHLPPVHSEKRARLHACRLQPGRLQSALLSHREELAAHEVAADRRGGAPVSLGSGSG